MKKGNVTLKDLSEATGYSLVSIHRAIYNKEGLRPETREKILAAVSDMGYEVNYLASSLKRKTVRIAYVGRNPKEDFDYHFRVLNGARAAFRQFEGMNISWTEYLFDGATSELGDKECEKLEEIFNSNDVDALLVFPINTGIKIQLALQKIIGKGIPVVLVDDYFKDMEFLCAVVPHYYTAGQVAAEYLTSNAGPGTFLVALGVPKSRGTYKNYQGFSEYLHNNTDGYKCVAIEDPFDEDKMIDAIASQIDDSVVGLYAVCERNSPALCKAAQKAGRTDLQIVGFDLSKEDLSFLSQGKFKGVIDTDPYMQGYFGVRILLESVLKNIKPESRIISVPVNVVMKSNMSFYTNERLYGIHVTGYSDED